MVKRLLLHIGYHKTATSWMQNCLFVPEHGYRQVARHADVWEHVVGKHGLRFDAEEMRAVIGRGMLALRSREVPVVSSEILSGHPFFGGIGSDVFAQRLKEIAPGARILVSVRHQYSALVSVFLQYLLRGGTMAPEEFFSGDRGLGFYGFRPEHFEYHRLVAFYQSLFGTQNVYLVSQESLASNVDHTVRGLADFAENEQFDQVLSSRRYVYAPSYPEHAVPILRWINRFQRSILRAEDDMSVETKSSSMYRLAGAGMRRRPISTLLRSYRPVTKCVKRKFEHRFDDSNKELLSMINQDLLWHELEIPGKSGGHQLENQVALYPPRETTDARVLARSGSAGAD